MSFLAKAFGARTQSPPRSPRTAPARPTTVGALTARSRRATQPRHPATHSAVTSRTPLQRTTGMTALMALLFSAIGGFSQSPATTAERAGSSGFCFNDPPDHRRRTHRTLKVDPTPEAAEAPEVDDDDDENDEEAAHDVTALRIDASKVGSSPDSTAQAIFGISADAAPQRSPKATSPKKSKKAAADTTTAPTTAASSAAAALGVLMTTVGSNSTAQATLSDVSGLTKAFIATFLDLPALAAMRRVSKAWAHAADTVAPSRIPRTAFPGTMFRRLAADVEPETPAPRGQWLCLKCDNVNPKDRKRCVSCSAEEGAYACRVFLGQQRKEATVAVLSTVLRFLCPSVAPLHIECQTRDGNGNGCAWLYLDSLQEAQDVVRALHHRVFLDYDANAAAEGFWVSASDCRGALASVVEEAKGKEGAEGRPRTLGHSAMTAEPGKKSCPLLHDALRPVIDAVEASLPSRRTRKPKMASAAALQLASDLAEQQRARRAAQAEPAHAYAPDHHAFAGYDQGYGHGYGYDAAYGMVPQWNAYPMPHAQPTAPAPVEAPREPCSKERLPASAKVFRHDPYDTEAAYQVLLSEDASSSGSSLPEAAM